MPRTAPRPELGAAGDAGLRRGTKTTRDGDMGQAVDTSMAGGNADILLREDRGPVALLTLNRPAARNSLCDALLAALQAAVDDIARSRSVRAAVIAGNGPVFCAGHDLKEMTGYRNSPDGGRARFEATMASCARLMQSIMESPKPIVAAVAGTATAAGCQLVASCDLAVAATTARFCTPGVNIGLFCSSPAVALVRNIGRKRALEMLLLGDMIGAREAHDYGLVNRVVEPAEVLPEALRLAQQIASKPAATIAVGKRDFQTLTEAPLAEAYARAARTMVESMLHADSVEGIGAFLDKRQPDWRQE